MTALRATITLFLVLSTAFSLSAQDRSYGRSVVSSQYGIVATSQVSASQAGARILEQGGSAIDAARLDFRVPHRMGCTMPAWSE